MYVFLYIFQPICLSLAWPTFSSILISHDCMSYYLYWTSSALPQEHIGCPWGLSVQLFHSPMVSSLSLSHTFKSPSNCTQTHANSSNLLYLYTFSYSCMCLCLRSIAAAWPCQLGLVWHSLQPPQWVQLASPHQPTWPKPTHQCTSMWEDRCTPVVSLRSLNTQNLGKNTHTP